MSSSRNDHVSMGTFESPIQAFGSSNAPARTAAFSFIRMRSPMEAREGFPDRASLM